MTPIQKLILGLLTIVGALILNIWLPGAYIIVLIIAIPLLHNISIKSTPKFLWSKYPYFSLWLIPFNIVSIIFTVFPALAAGPALFLFWGSLAISTIGSLIRFQLPRLAKLSLGSRLFKFILNTLDEEEQTKLVCAKNWRKNPILIPELLNTDKLPAAQKTEYLKRALFHSIENRDMTIVNLISNTTNLSTQEKINLFTQVDSNGHTPLAKSAILGNCLAISSILNSVPQDQRAALLTYHNPIENNTTEVVVLAFENGRHLAVINLELFGAVLPAHLRQAGPGALANNFNNGQSTHTATVHDSLARSSIALVARLQDIPKNDKTVLLKWAKGLAGQSDDIQKQQASLKIMKQASTQKILNALVEKHYKDIEAWANSLDNAHPKKAVVIRAIKKIKVSNHYREARTHLKLPQALVLSWIALRADKGEINNTSKHFTGEKLTDNMNMFIDHLNQIQRQYNFNDKNKDNYPNAPDMSACPGGTFNNIIASLRGIDEEVAFVFVTPETNGTILRNQSLC